MTTAPAPSAQLPLGPWAPAGIIVKRRRVAVLVVPDEAKRKIEALEEDRDRWRQAFEGADAERERWHGAFRRERGRVAGLQSAFTKQKKKTTTAEAACQELMQALERPKPQHPNADLVIAKLRQDLGHAVDCLQTECKRCDLIERRLSDGAAHYVEERSVADQLEFAERLVDLGRGVFKAMRQRGVGAQEQYRTAITALLSAVKECGADDD